MMVAFRVMTYFKVSLSTRNWDSANNNHTALRLSKGT